MVIGKLIFFIIVISTILINTYAYELWGDCYNYNENGICFTIKKTKIHCKKLVDEERGKCMPIQ